jgi:hypothetical protein
MTAMSWNAMRQPVLPRTVVYASSRPTKQGEMTSLKLACCIQPKTEPRVPSSVDSATSDWINGTTGIASWNASECAKL